MTAQRLRGIRIVDLSMGWAGPLATRHLADLGAEIIKVEACQRPDWWRGWEATPAWITDHGYEKSASFNTVNRNKLDVTLDLTALDGKALLKRLVAISDAVIENYSGAVLRNLGLDYAALAVVNPGLVMISMPAFGSTGPWRDYRAYGSTVEQASGLPHLHGRPQDPPVMLHVAYGDPVAGLNAAAALLIALRHRRRTGKGQYIDLAQSACLFPLGAHGIIEQSLTGTAPARLGNRSRYAAPHGVFPCAGDDAWITLQVFREDQWHRLVALAGAALEGFGGAADRLRRVDALEAAVAAWTRRFAGDELMNRLQAAGVPAAVLRAPSELVDDPHLQARGFWTTVDRAHVGPQPHPAAPYREGQEPYPIDAPAPTLGEHNGTVLRELLGLTVAEIEDLTARHVIGDRVRLPDGTALTGC
jgi:crotonobetainyl-CoA:carnitine CoA-transferase CaiB-like acyl-CoA transferase